MMALPFLTFFFAIVATIIGHRRSAIIIWVIGLLVTGFLFHLHATDPLHLAF